MLENLISESWQEELYKYISGIFRNNSQKLIAINGTSDHIHILLGIAPNIALSDLVRDIKANSSRFINDKNFVNGKFYWQEGFGAFSYSRSQLDNVIKYIENQKQHHEKQSFKNEYLGLLKKFDVDYKNEYLFEFADGWYAVPTEL